jgi:hypothetical protein
MSEPIDIEYRGHFIVVQSYESDSKRWRPKALVSIYHAAALQQTVVSAPVDVWFDSEEDAVTYSLAAAKKWIDDQEER